MNLLWKSTLNVSVVITFFRTLDLWKILLKKRGLFDEITWGKKACIKKIMVFYIFLFRHTFFSPVISSNNHRYFDNIFHEFKPNEEGYYNQNVERRFS